MRVHNGDQVRAGDRLCEGAIDPHDILHILGTEEVQEYLVNEVQDVYRLQGVKINDKHIEVIVRQMLQKVQVEEVGDTNFLEGEKVDKNRFRLDNERVMAEGVSRQPHVTCCSVLPEHHCQPRVSSRQPRSKRPQRS